MKVQDDIAQERKVLVSGFFDPPHRGHIAYLREAKKLGDKLVVLVHRDECCVKKKGYCFMPLEDRVAVVEAVRYVDEVVICEPNCDLTTCDALLKVRPYVFAKGGDRTPDNMPKCELELCEKLGIEIVYGVGGQKVQSSSWLVENCKKRLKPKSSRK
ncbi:MAG: adenylyltransferase/cytidyltransferase family protein [Nitrososphaerota archaeon]|nr:adenylyltransferase/cytidyltransferase family protein [Candidatus Bathyarchaeota archaeon]MDW8023704.1 adenylyltransferase/cytidyltransferase family protein [Nitrososphaerota archaeon]